MIAAEYEATQLYMQLAESTENKLAIAVLRDIADEENSCMRESFSGSSGNWRPRMRSCMAQRAKKVKKTIKKMK